MPRDRVMPSGPREYFSAAGDTSDRVVTRLTRSQVCLGLVAMLGSHAWHSRERGADWAKVIASGQQRTVKLVYNRGELFIGGAI